MMEQDKSINVNTPQEDDRQLNEQEQEWARQQEELKSKLICNDTEAWSTSPADESQPRFVAGLDVSYDKNHPTEGCAALVIYDLQNKSLVYQDTAFVCVNTNYSAGFLAFREIGFLLDLVKTFRDKLKNLPDNIEPHVWLVDGNGLMHPRRFGLACHFGVLIDRPTIGVSKNPHFFLPGPRANRDQYKKDLESALNHRGDQFEILDEHSSVMGVALKSAESAKNPVYVSIGHRISLKTAVKVVLKCCVKFKNPEPVRQADMISREALRRR